MRPTIPYEEFKMREQKMQQLMKEQGIDLVITYSDDRYVYGQAYSRWLYDYRPAFEPACVLLPAEGDGVIITGPESEHLVKEFSHCEHTYIVEEFLHPDEEYSYCEPIKMQLVIDKLEQGLNRKIEKVAVASAGDIPNSIYKMLNDHFNLEQAEVADDLFTQLRKVKTDNEIAVLRYAYKIADIGMSSGLDSLREGITEREVAAKIGYAISMAGAEGTGIELMVSFGKEHTYPVLSHVTDRQLKRGDLVVITLAPRYEGYHGAIARSVIFGGSNPEAQRALDYAEQAITQASQKLAAGVRGSEVDGVSRKIMAEGGYADNFAYTGVHSVGTIEFEPPIMASYEETMIEENMVISIDVPVFMAPFGGLRIEHGFLVTDKGAESLLETPFTIK